MSKLKIGIIGAGAISDCHIEAYMNNPDITTRELMKYVKGPDFPTGGIVINQDD